MVKIKNLSYRYTRQKLLFNGLNLELQTGKIYGLLGKNGAGKSTLMKIITGLLFPGEGTCQVNGMEPQKRERTFLEQLFFIPEECYLPPLSITDFLAIYAPFYPLFSQTVFYAYLEEFNIPTNGSLHRLSYGQKKKTFIAFGLAANTSLLIMDEPTNGLDIPSKVQFRKIMANQAGASERTILISTHQVRDLDDLISSVIIMDESRVILHQEKDRIAQHVHFLNRQETTIDDEILYEEQTPNGTMAMCVNRHKAGTYIDMEILFNATLSNPALVQSLF